MIEPERLAYDLGPDSLVWDVGAYRGEFACEAIKRWGCRLQAFEPMLLYVDGIQKKLAMLTDRAQVFPFGLLDRDHEADIPLAGDRTSLYPEHAIKGDESGGCSMPARFRDVVAFMQEHDIRNVDLAKVNIEGGEFCLLPHLARAGMLGRFRHLQVQFHDFMPDADKRYNRLRRDLETTHRLSWRNPWVWESWERRWNTTASASGSPCSLL